MRERADDEHDAGKGVQLEIMVLLLKHGGIEAHGFLGELALHTDLEGVDRLPRELGIEDRRQRIGGGRIGHPRQIEAARLRAIAPGGVPHHLVREAIGQFDRSVEIVLAEGLTVRDPGEEWIERRCATVSEQQQPIVGKRS